MNGKHHRLFGIPILFLGLIGSYTALAQDVTVTGAEPGAAPPATYGLEVIISGTGFDKSAKVNFLKSSTGEPAEIVVNRSKVTGSTQITVNIDVSDTATDQDQYDIEVKMSRGRGGKGTTLFKVQSKDTNPSECNFNFEATFDDVVNGNADGIRSDDSLYYDAIGGKGFRLDTNGSIKLERRNDTRFIMIDFSNALQGSADCDVSDPNNAAGAAGFCNELQGVDLRLEHQIQDLETTGLCTIEWDPTQDPAEDPDKLAVRLSFEAEAGGLLRNPSKNGRDDGGVVALSLNYGCLAPRLEQSVMKDEYLAEVTREGPGTWRIVGEYACLHTNLGHMLRAEPGEDGSLGAPIYLYMPFGLTIVDVETL